MDECHDEEICGKHDCVNTFGSFRCECKAGFHKLEVGGIYAPVQDRALIQQDFQNHQDSLFRGKYFDLIENSSFQTKCFDINECSSKPCGENAFCINRYN